MKYIKYLFSLLLVLSLDSSAEMKVNHPKQETANELLVKDIANNLKDERLKNPNMSDEEQKAFVITSIDAVDKSQRGAQILSALKQEHIDAIQVSEKMNSCISKANEKKDAQFCLKELEQSFSALGKSYPVINSDNLVWTEQLKQYILNTTTKMIKLSENSLNCLNENKTVTSVFKCNPQKTKYTAYDLIVNQVVALANTNLILEMGDKIFNESCKLSKVTVFEQPIHNKGVFFDKSYYDYGSYHDVNEKGEYKNINHYTDDKSRINNKELLSSIGFFEKYENIFDKEMKKTYKKFYYFDENKLSGVSIEEIKSRYKVITEQLKNENKYSYGVNGFSIKIIDMESNKTIAETVFYDNYQKKKLCGETYDGNLDQEYFVLKVFSR
jgi:hypothetical protein